MTQIAQLSEAEIDERFRIVGARPVAFLLAGFARENDAFSVHFRDGDEMFLSTLLAADAERGRLIFDCSGSPETNRRFLACERSAFVGRPGGVLVQFHVGQAREILFGGSKAFIVPLPDSVIRLQRREHFRIETPRVNPLEFFGRMPDGGLLRLVVHDISVGGIGADTTVQPAGIEPGLVLPNCHFSLPGDSRDMFFSATVRHVRELSSRAGTRLWRIGLQFNDLPTGDQTRIQRYIAKVERERHELI